MSKAEGQKRPLSQLPAISSKASAKVLLNETGPTNCFKKHHYWYVTCWIILIIFPNLGMATCISPLVLRISPLLIFLLEHFFNTYFPHKFTLYHLTAKHRQYTCFCFGHRLGGSRGQYIARQNPVYVWLQNLEAWSIFQPWARNMPSVVCIHMKTYPRIKLYVS